MVNTVSTVLVGHLGARDLAAVGLAVSLANVSGYSAPQQEQIIHFYHLYQFLQVIYGVLRGLIVGFVGFTVGFSRI